MFEGNQQQDAHEVMKIQFCRDNFILYSFEKKKLNEELNFTCLEKSL